LILSSITPTKQGKRLLMQYNN